MTNPSNRPAPKKRVLPPTAPGQIEIWKKIIDVQQHFNDLELRIRNFALVVTGAFLGLGGYAIKDGGVIKLFSHEIAIAGLVVASAIIPLFAFYFMDRLWYHRLLDGSVKAGIDAETELKLLGYQVDLGTQISVASPFRFWVTGWHVHSKTKMDIFYGMLLVALILVAAFLGLGVRSEPTAAATSGVFATQGPLAGKQPAPAPETNVPPGPIKPSTPATHRALTSPSGPAPQSPASDAGGG